jgi:hypothetical protein
VRKVRGKQFIQSTIFTLCNPRSGINFNQPPEEYTTLKVVFFLLVRDDFYKLNFLQNLSQVIPPNSSTRDDFHLIEDVIPHIPQWWVFMLRMACFIPCHFYHGIDNSSTTCGFSIAYSITTLNR